MCVLQGLLEAAGYSLIERAYNQSMRLDWPPHLTPPAEQHVSTAAAEHVSSSPAVADHDPERVPSPPASSVDEEEIALEQEEQEDSFESESESHRTGHSDQQRAVTAGDTHALSSSGHQALARVNDSPRQQVSSSSEWARYSHRDLFVSSGTLSSRLVCSSSTR